MPRRSLQGAREPDQPGHPLRAIPGGAHPYRQVVAHQGPGVAVVRLALRVAAGRLLEVDAAHRPPADRQPGLGDIRRPGRYSSGWATTRVTTTVSILDSGTDSVDAAAKVPVSAARQGGRRCGRR